MRERYPFDENPFVGCSTGYSLWADKTKRFFYLEGGRNTGCRVLVEFDKGRVGIGRLHDSETVIVEEQLSEEYILSALRRAANDDVRPLLHINEVPGFQPRTSTLCARHDQGWFTRSRFAVELPAPTWADTAHVYHLREGNLLVFPDGSIRLIRRKEYYAFDRWGLYARFLARQGDCYVVRDEPPSWARSVVVNQDSITDGCSLDRHRVFVASYQDGTWELRHPQHERVVFPIQGDVWLMLMPGSSRPFSNEDAD